VFAAAGLASGTWVPGYRRAAAKIAEIDGRIADLQQIRHNLEAVLAARCESLTECSCGMAVNMPLGTAT
jgi:MerR family mercuric resistance operon transcriptional regulator